MLMGGIMKLVNNKYKIFIKNFHMASICIIISILILMSTLSLILTINALADGGHIPFNNFSTYEPGQKAIVAWDGEEEILILSVDVYASENNKVLHMVPLPSLPTVKLGNTTSFEKINELIDERGIANGGDGEAEGEGESGYEIEFHEQIGPHEITIVKVNNTQEFITWVTNFLNANGVETVSLPEGIEDVIDHYIDQKINHFVFDVIEISQTEKSVEPIIYQFKTDCLYYPLLISSLIEGYTTINLVTITPNNLPVDHFEIKNAGFDTYFGFKITHQKISEISTELAELIPTSGYLAYYENHFKLKDLDTDIKINLMENVNWIWTTENYIYQKLFIDCNGDDIKDIIFSTTDEIYSLNGIDGDLLWQFDAEISSGYFKYLQLVDIDLDHSPEILAYLADSENSTIYAIKSENGYLIWKYDLNKKDGYYDLSEPRIDDVDSDGRSEIIIWADRNNLQVVNIEDGTKLWNYKASSSTATTEYILNFQLINPNLDSTLEVLVISDKYVYYLNGKNGDLIWKTDISSTYFCILSNNLDKTIFDYTLDGWPEILIPYYEGLTLLNCEDGSPVWSFQTDKSQGSKYVGPNYEFYDSDSNGIVEIYYFKDDDIYVVNASNGAELWHISNLKTSNSYGARNFKFHDVDNDGVIEIVLTHGNDVYCINANNGTVQWHYSFNYEYLYSSISELLIEDIDQDGTIEIICSYYKKIIAFEGSNGSILWEYKSNYDISIESGLEDFDNDNNFEIIIYSDYKIYLFNCKDGSIAWSFYKDQYGNYNYLFYHGASDIDNDGKSEIIIFNDACMYALSPKTGNVIWEFNAGLPYKFDYSATYNSIQDGNILVQTNDKIYSVNYEQISLAFNLFPNKVRSGEIVTIFIYVGFNEVNITDVNFKYTDFGLNGEFSSIIKSYPGVYVITYKVPNTTRDSINISIDAVHENYFGARGLIQIQIIQDPSGEEEIKKQLNVNAIATPDVLKPGENSTIIFNVSAGNEVVTTGLNFSLFDNNLDGTFSDISQIGNEYFRAGYTVPDIKSNIITIIILVSHDNYYDGIGIVELIINQEIENEVSEYNQTEIGQKPKLNLTLEPYPNQLKPGADAVILINIKSGEIPVDFAEIQTFDNGIGGSFSEINKHGGGRYSTTYALPENLPDSMNSVTLFFHVFHENYSSIFSSLSISINHSKIINELPEEEPVELKIVLHPEQISPGESTTIIILFNDRTNKISLSDIRLEISDNYSGGTFLLVSKFDDGRFIFEYTAPTVNLTLINISVIVHYNGQELIYDHIELELLQNQIENVNVESDDNAINYYLSIMIFIIVFIILLLILIIYIHLKRRNKKLKKINSKLTAKTNMSTSIKKNGKRSN